MLSRPTLLKSAFAAILVSGLTQMACAADQPEVQPQTPPATQPVPVRPHRPDPIHSRQIVEVIEADNAEDLSAKLQAILDSGVNINSLQNVTANGKSLVVVLGFPIPQPHLQPPIIHPAPGANPTPVPLSPAPVTAPVPAPVPAPAK